MFPAAPRAWTIDDLFELPDDGYRYELVDGSLVVTPPAMQDHQEIVNNVLLLLSRLAPEGWRPRMEYAMPLSHNTLRVPDVLVYRWPLQHRRADSRLPIGADDVGLAVEVVSPSSRRTDRFAKPGEYAEAGIPLYWRVETDPELVLHAFELHEGVYVPCAPRAPWGPVEVDVSVLGF